MDILKGTGQIAGEIMHQRIIRFPQCQAGNQRGGRVRGLQIKSCLACGNIRGCAWRQAVERAITEKRAKCSDFICHIIRTNLTPVVEKV